MRERTRLARNSMTPGRMGSLILGGLLGVAIVSDAVELRTDTSKALVPLQEIVSGGPPPDGIPAIDKPSFITPAAAAAWLAAQEPVLALEVKDDAHAYPLQILMWHEIVNDVVGALPVTVTFCPLCNSGIVFERVVDGTTLDFGTSGKLYKSDLVMYDRQSHSLWSQMEGRAIVGTRAGTQLKLVPANTLSFEEWRAAHPAGKVLSRETGHYAATASTPTRRTTSPAPAFPVSGSPGSSPRAQGARRRCEARGHRQGLSVARARRTQGRSRSARRRCARHLLPAGNAVGAR